MELETHAVGIPEAIPVALPRGGRVPFGGLATRAAIERHSNPNGLRRKTWKHSTITLRALLVLAEREF